MANKTNHPNRHQTLTELLDRIDRITKKIRREMMEDRYKHREQVGGRKTPKKR